MKIKSNHSFKNEIKICTNELTKQNKLSQKLIDLNKQIQILLKSSSVSCFF